MEKIKRIKLCFENCEVITLTPDMFKHLIIKGIGNNVTINCFQYENGEIDEYYSCGYLSITINEKGLKQQLSWEKEELNERIKRCNIVSVIIEYQNQKENEIYVPWNDDNDFINYYQNYEEDIEGVKVTIEEKKDE